MSDVNEPFVYKFGVEVPHDVIFVIVHPSVKILPNRLFRRRLQLKKVTLPEGLEEIGAHAFAVCTSLERINFPSSLIKIGDYAFEKCLNCRSLERINFPSTFINIGRYAFVQCLNLMEVTLPEGLKEIETYTFAACISLERINYPSTLIRIGNHSFQTCRSLKEVHLPEGLEEIGDEAFSGCKSLERIRCPSTLIKINKGAFNECRSLKDLTLPEGLEEIGAESFRNCEHLEHTNFLSTLIKIGRAAFSGCILLERMNCPSTLIRIGGIAFSECRSLTKVRLAGGVVTIEEDAFVDCDSLEGVTIPPKSFVIEVGSEGNWEEYSDGNMEVFTCRLVLTDDRTVALTTAEQVIVSPEHLNYIRSCDLLDLQLENEITTIMNSRWRTREDNIERVLALIKPSALFEVSTILELALWKNKMDAIHDSNFGTRAECRVTCGADDIIPGLVSYL